MNSNKYFEQWSIAIQNSYIMEFFIYLKNTQIAKVVHMIISILEKKKNPAVLIWWVLIFSNHRPTNNSKFGLEKKNKKK